MRPVFGSLGQRAPADYYSGAAYTQGYDAPGMETRTAAFSRGGGGGRMDAVPQLQGGALARAASPGANIGPIGGKLGFGGSAANMFMQNPALGYQSAYLDALGANQQNYNNILAGYQQAYGSQIAQQQAIVNGWNSLQGDVVGGLQGANAANVQAIADRYAMSRGQANQSLVDRGLGNTTVRDSVLRGLSYDQQKAMTDSTNAFQNTIAGYKSQIGMGRLNYQGGAVDDNTNLLTNQLNWMNSIQVPYPDAGQYAALAAMQGGNAAGAPGMGGRGGGGGGPLGGGGPAGGGVRGPGGRPPAGGGGNGPNVVMGGDWGNDAAWNLGWLANAGQLPGAPGSYYGGAMGGGDASYAGENPWLYAGGDHYASWGM